MNIKEILKWTVMFLITGIVGAICGYSVSCDYFFSRMIC